MDRCKDCALATFCSLATPRVARFRRGFLQAVVLVVVGVEVVVEVVEVVVVSAPAQ